ncbi:MULTISPECIES: DNA adenine methylase [Pseudomonas]|jgi:DNA adenine methylase|uniref:DNA adenine methylase n=1 Tax=Pseudomonas TaxID=286 RepID=UPI0014700A5E|nr:MULTISPECIES: DNA adenine methylase [Pseudomonas]KAF4559231.1 DNA adenine methylase [Pseudomonas sp. CES]MDM9601904.1 DNA adenine methylase [Pseudomonas shirazica]MDO2416439.1 DNA adenine methylase [Pseudomonas shirazica]
MYSNKLYSPLRYPGGKARFAPFIAEVMRANGLDGGHYLEPFAGGAGVALELLFDGHASHVHINDLDPAVHAFWSAVTSDSEGLLRLLRDTPITMDEWHRLRQVMLDQDPSLSITERGFATLFVNRTNRSGILKGGVIGGKAQTGTYKLDARFNKDMIAARLDRIAQHAHNITVHQEDAYSLLSRASELLPDRSLIYLDPPYYVKGRDLYRNFYKHDDHLQIAQLLQSPGFMRQWVVSYDSAPEICEMYSGSEALKYGLHYTAQARYVGDEVMFFKDGLKVPDAEIPKAAAAG